MIHCGIIFYFKEILMIKSFFGGVCNFAGIATGDRLKASRASSVVSIVFMLAAGASGSAWSSMAPSLTTGVNDMQAATEAALVTLPDAVSYENIGVIFFANSRTSTSVGTLVYTGPGCGGLCSATTQLGPDPSASATVNEVGYDNSGGGTATSNLGYYVEYVNKPGTYNINMHAADSLFTGTASVSTYLEFGLAGNDYSHFNNFLINTPIELAEQDSTDTNCGSCVLSSYTPHFKTDNVVQMVANTPYFVQLGVNLDLEADGIPNGATVDPTFSDPTSSGTFVFSPGVVSSAAAVPEPSTWMMMLIGVGVTGVAIRRSRGENFRIRGVA